MNHVANRIDLKELICNLIGYLKKADSLHCIKTIDSHYRHFTINKGNGYSRNFRVSSLSAYIEAHLTMPFREIYSSTILSTTNIEPHLFDICILHRNEIRGEFEEIYYNYSDRLNDEQSTVRDFLYSLRANVLYTENDDVFIEDRQRLYTILRNALCFKLNEDYTPIIDEANAKPLGANIWSTLELELLIANLSMEFGYNDRLSESIYLFRNCFEPITSRGNIIKVCSVCGLPLKKNGGKYYCVSDNTCKKHPFCRFQHSFDYILDSHTKYFRVKDGVQYFVNRTGIVEYFTYLDFKDMFEPYGVDVIQYPSLDAEGDIKLTKNNVNILIDLKDWMSYESLAKDIEKEPNKYAFKDILYVPSYRYNSYSTSISARNRLSLALRNNCYRNNKFPLLSSGTDTDISYVDAVNRKFAEKGVTLNEES